MSKRRRKHEPDNPAAELIRSAERALRRMGITRRLILPSRKAPGSPPGTLIHTGERHTEDVRVRRITYTADTIEELDGLTIAEALTFPPSPDVTWINVDGLHDVEAIAALRDDPIHLHPLLLEDILSVGQRPKVEEHDGYLFLILRILRWDADRKAIDEEQLSLVLGPHWVMTFQERPGEVLHPIRERLLAARGKVRERGADYLLYTLVDAVVDSYFSVLEGLGQQIEDAEEELFQQPGRDALRHVHYLRREALILRRAVWPLREAIGSLLRNESSLITDTTKVFLRDVHDHTFQVIDAIETLREVISSLMELHLSTMGNRTNEVMKVLTIIGSIFIPLTFLAGIYGMNFTWMPELEIWWAYPVTLLVMLLTAVGLVTWFRFKGWL